MKSAMQHAVRVIGTLALGLSMQSLSAAEVAPQTIEVTLGSYYIKPEKIQVKAGVPVTLNIKNEASVVPHNLAISAPEAGIDVKADVGGGKQVSVTFTPSRSGTYEMVCTKKMPLMKSHKDKGMKGVVEVVP